MTAAVRILLVDDHTIVRQGLRSILELEPDFSVIGEASTPDEAVAQAARLRPDVVLLDLKLSDAAPAEGLDVCAALRGQRADLAVVVLTTFLDERLLVGALRRGASGYALKDVDAVELARIVRAVHRGQSAFDARSADLAARSLMARPAPAPACSATASSRWSGRSPGARPTRRSPGSCTCPSPPSSTTCGRRCASSAPGIAPSSSSRPASSACSDPDPPARTPAQGSGALSGWTVGRVRSGRFALHPGRMFAPAGAVTGSDGKPSVTLNTHVDTRR